MGFDGVQTTTFVAAVHRCCQVNMDRMVGAHFRDLWKKIMSLIDDLKLNAPSRSPIRDEVTKHMTEIEEAVAKGYSLQSIFVTLKKQGYKVGKGISSFAAAVKFLRNQKPGERFNAAAEGVKIREEVVDPASKANATSGAPRNPFADNRHLDDFRGE